MSRYCALDHRIRLDYVLHGIRRLNPKKVIDFGCGQTPIQNLQFDAYLGIDMFDIPSFNKPNYKFMKANYEEPLDLPLNFFDLALWLEGPEHTLKHKQVFDNIRKALAPDGFLIITCPNEKKWVVHPQYEHKCQFGLADLRSLVEENGFTVLEIAEVYSRIPPHLIGYHWLYCLATLAKYDPRYVKGGLK